MATNKHSAGFTLIELMVVLGIIGLITLFAIPAFQGAGRMPAMRSSINELRSTISLARQHAITHRTVTHVVFPVNNTVVPDVADEAYRSFNVYHEMTDEDSEDVIGEFLFEWRYLPQGIVFDDENLPTKNVFLIGAQDALPGTRSISFLPTGVMDNAQTEIIFTEGYLDGTSPQRAPATANQPRLTLALDIYPFTGHARVREHQFTE